MSVLISKPLSIELWSDLEELFGERGACGGCWCMTWRLKASDYNESKGPANKKLFKALVRNGEPVGVIAYSEDIPVGWCSVSPKKKLVRIENSRNLKSVDALPVWSVICFFVRKEFRKSGVSAFLLQKAIQFAKRNGAKIIEGYPVIPKDGNMPSVFAYTGFISVFEKAGFTRVVNKKGVRPIARLAL